MPITKTIYCCGRTLIYLWASPWSAVGLFVGLAGLATGGGCRRRGPILEFWGGWVTGGLAKVPGVAGASAMTLGHVVLGLDQATLDGARQHELVHVRQYERWGPLFVPAYLTCSLVLWTQGRAGYWDNPFECEAYQATAGPDSGLV